MASRGKIFMQVRNQINIVGSGLAGLLTTYFLLKNHPRPENLTIKIFDSQSKFADNASTNSLAWLNVSYPSKSIPGNGQNGEMHEAYDKFRSESLQAWEGLIKELANDGITQISATQKERIHIQAQDINSLHVFFDAKQEQEYLKRISRTSVPQSNKISEQAELAAYFPFISHLAKDIIIYNSPDEQLLNPNMLRMQLINHLEKNKVEF